MAQITRNEINSCFLCVFLLLFSSSGVAFAELPKGAIARLGGSGLRHNGPVGAVRFSLNGTRLISTGWDGTVNVWEVQSRTQILSIPALYDRRSGFGRNAPPAACINSDGTMAVVAGFDMSKHVETIHLWDISKAQQEATFSVPIKGYGGVSDLTFTPDGNYLAVSGDDNSMRIFDIHKRAEKANWVIPYEFDFKEFFRIEGSRPTGVYSIAFSPDGELLASSSQDGVVRLWTPSGQLVKKLRRKEETSPHFTDGAALSFSHDGKRLAVVYGEDEHLIVWNIETGAEELSRKWKHLSIGAVSFSSDGKYLAVGANYTDVLILDALSGADIFALHDESEVASVAFSPNTKLLAAGLRNNTISLWDLESHEKVNRDNDPAGPIMSLSYSSDGKLLASGSWDRHFRVWDVSTHRTLCDNNQTALQQRVMFAPGTKILAVNNVKADKAFISPLPVVTLWDIDNQKILKELVIKESGAEVQSIAFSKVPKLLAAGVNGMVYVWEISGYREMSSARMSSIESSRSELLTFSPDGKYLVVGDTVGLWIWKAPFKSDSDGQFIDINKFRADFYNSRHTAIAFSPDGKMFSAARTNGSIDQLKGETFDQLDSFDCHKGRVLSMDYSPNGQFLALGNEDMTVSLCDTLERRETTIFEGHKGGVQSVVFSPDGRTVASGGADSVIFIWQIPQRPSG